MNVTHPGSYHGDDCRPAEDTMTEETKETNVKIRLVFRSMSDGIDGKPVTVWVREQEVKSSDPKFCIYSAKLKGMMKHARAGHIYELEAKDSEGQSIYSSTARYVGRLQDKQPELDAKVAEWEAIDIAWRELDKAKKAQKAATEEGSSFSEHVAALRKAMKKVNAPQRAQLLAWIVRELTK